MCPCGSIVRDAHKAHLKDTPKVSQFNDPEAKILPKGLIAQDEWKSRVMEILKEKGVNPNRPRRADEDTLSTKKSLGEDDTGEADTKKPKEADKKKDKTSATITADKNPTAEGSKVSTLRRSTRKRGITQEKIIKLEPQKKKSKTESETQQPASPKAKEKPTIVKPTASKPKPMEKPTISSQPASVERTPSPSRNATIYVPTRLIPDISDIAIPAEELKRIRKLAKSKGLTGKEHTDYTNKCATEYKEASLEAAIEEIRKEQMEKLSEEEKPKTPEIRTLVASDIEMLDARSVAASSDQKTPTPDPTIWIVQLINQKDPFDFETYKEPAVASSTKSPNEVFPIVIRTEADWDIASDFLEVERMRTRVKGTIGTIEFKKEGKWTYYDKGKETPMSHADIAKGIRQMHHRNPFQALILVGDHDQASTALLKAIADPTPRIMEETFIFGSGGLPFQKEWELLTKLAVSAMDRRKTDQEAWKRFIVRQIPPYVVSRAYLFAVNHHRNLFKPIHQIPDPYQSLPSSGRNRSDSASYD